MKSFVFFFYFFLFPLMPHLNLLDGARELLERAQTGWLMLVYGCTLGGLFTEAYTRSKDSHVGMIVRLYALELDALHQQLRGGPHKLPRNGLLVWEVVHEAAPCYDYVKARMCTTGPRLVALDELIRRSRAALDIRLQPLTLASSGCHVSHVDLNNMMVHFCVEMSTCAFDDRWFVLFKAAYDGPFGENKDDIKEQHRLFCSDGISRFLVRCGLLPAETQTTEITPADFEQGAVHLIGGASFSNRIFLLAQCSLESTQFRIQSCLLGCCSIM